MSVELLLEVVEFFVEVHSVVIGQIVVGRAIRTDAIATIDELSKDSSKMFDALANDASKDESATGALSSTNESPKALDLTIESRNGRLILLDCSRR